METVYELRRTPLESKASRKTYANRLVKDADQTLLTGETRRGYATRPVTFQAFDEHNIRTEVTFGRNRRVAGSAFELKDGDGAMVARIETGLVQRSWGGPAFPVQDRQGDEIFRLVPAEKLVDGPAASFGRWADDDLILQAEKQMIGYTGQANPITQTNPARDLGKRLLRNAAHLTIELGSRVLDTVRGKAIDHPEVCVARLTLLPEAPHLDPRIALAVLLFKAHYFDLRTPS